MKGRPIRPDEVYQIRPPIPPAVFDVFNELITKNMSDQRSRFTLREVVDLILKRVPGILATTIFEMHWLDVETAYREAGWLVEYDRLAAFFVFTKPPC